MKHFILNNYKTILIIILIVITVAAIGHADKVENRLQNANAEKVLLENKIDSFKNKNNQLVLQVQDAQFTNDKYIKELSNEIFNLRNKNAALVKKINYYGQIEQQWKIDTILIPYTDTQYIVQNLDSFIKVPKQFNLENKDYSLAGTINTKSISINTLKIDNTVSFRSIEQRQGLFKPTVTVVQVVNSNPYVNTTGLQTMSVKHKRSAWDRWIFPVISAAAGGATVYYITK